jgi:hypothetical protein
MSYEKQTIRLIFIFLTANIVRGSRLLLPCIYITDAREPYLLLTNNKW